jgi:predicted phosphodiesterase
MKRIVKIISLLVIIFLFSTHIYAQGKNQQTRFAIIGDRTGGHVPGVYKETLKEIETLHPEFIITVGDMIEGYTDDANEINTQWNEFKKIVDFIDVPIYYTPGNHDIWSDESESIYREYIGEPYFSFDVRNIHFIILDNSRWRSSSELPEEQIRWLENDLEANHQKFTFVFIHKPFWYKSTADGEPDILHSLFAKHDVTAVFTGHYHDYFVGNYDNVIYTGVGSSGAFCDPGPTGVLYHYVKVVVDEDWFSIDLIKLGGDVLPWDELTAEERKFTRKIDANGISFDKRIYLHEDMKIDKAEIEVSVNNLNSHLIIEDDIRWKLPDGWNVSPNEAHVKVIPGESANAKFVVENAGDVSELPRLCMKFPYAENKKYELVKTLPIRREIICAKADSPPKIDGYLTESIWKNPATLLFAPNGAPIQIDPSAFYFSYDEDNLYIAAHCEDSDIDLLFRYAEEHDGRISKEDCIGYVFQPDMTKDVKYLIYFNAFGYALDYKYNESSDRSWNGTYVTKTVVDDGYWNFEAQIPLEQFAEPLESGEQWEINFWRYQKRHKDTAEWLPQTNDKGYLIME